MVTRVTLLLLLLSLAISLTNAGKINVEACEPLENEVLTSSESCREVNVDPEGYTLNHVVILSRHSMRAPVKFDNDSLSASMFPLGLGYSTQEGNKFSVKVGKIWRKFYKNFLEGVTVRNIWARSSSYIRCAETQQLVLANMFPPEGDFDFGFPIQPIAYVRTAIGNDVNVETCDVPAPETLPKLNDLEDEALKKDGFDNFGAFVEYIASNTKFLANETKYYEPVIDALYCAKYSKLEIPDWATKAWSSMDFAMRLLSFEYWINEIPYYGNYIGKNIADRLNGSANGDYPEKFSFFSYHDTSIQAVLNAMGNKVVENYPSFIGALHFQVYKKDDDGKLYVRTMFHQGATLHLDYAKAREIVLEKCPFPDCTVDQLVELLSHIYDDVDRSNCSPINLKALQ